MKIIDAPDFVNYIEQSDNGIYKYLSEKFEIYRGLLLSDLDCKAIAISYCINVLKWNEISTHISESERIEGNKIKFLVSCNRKGIQNLHITIDRTKGKIL